MYIIICQACEDGDKYFKSLLDLSTFGDSVCPCGRDDNGLRKLFCCNGVCGECKDFELPECDGDEGVPAHDVKYKWLRRRKLYKSKPVNTLAIVVGALVHSSTSALI